MLIAVCLQFGVTTNEELVSMGLVELNNRREG